MSAGIGFQFFGIYPFGGNGILEKLRGGLWRLLTMYMRILENVQRLSKPYRVLRTYVDMKLSRLSLALVLMVI
jgi:hypothetical protein